MTIGTISWTFVIQTHQSYLPDPFEDLKDWIGEKEEWRNSHQFPILTFLHGCCRMLHVCANQQWAILKEKEEGSPSLCDRLVSGYKEGKAYSYFDSKWLHEVWYHPVGATSLICFLKAFCTPIPSSKERTTLTMGCN